MDNKKYKITCLRCRNFNIATIKFIGPNEYMIDLDTGHKKNLPHIISGRYRKDMNFGWECRCGNDSRLARQELPEIEKLVVNGGQKAIEDIAESLKIKDENKFKMIEVISS